MASLWESTERDLEALRSELLYILNRHRDDPDLSRVIDQIDRQLDEAFIIVESRIISDRQEE